MLKPKKTPLRRCVGCYEMKDKRELLRVVKEEGGRIFIDTTGKANGRGAYICKDVACFETARKKGGFARSFKCSVENEIYDKLKEEIENL